MCHMHNKLQQDHPMRRLLMLFNWKWQAGKQEFIPLLETEITSWNACSIFSDEEGDFSEGNILFTLKNCT